MKPFMGTFLLIKFGFLVPFAFFLPLEIVASSYHNNSAPTQYWKAPPPPLPPPPPPQNHTRNNNTTQNTSVIQPAPAPPIGASFLPDQMVPEPSMKSKKFGDKRLVFMAIIISVGLLALGLAFVFVFWLKRSRAVKPLETATNRQLQTSLTSGVLLLNRSELESACESFINIVGSVSDGLLYKGTLSSGIEIAVSSIELDKALGGLSEAQFRKKIATLSKVKHRNFVNLLGYCEEDSLTRMLVFEYVPNGTLFEHLHPTETGALSWAARMRIAMGVAYCLDYMHQLDPPIVLKNLDTSLIFLTDDYAAKVADFELWSGTAEGGTVVGSSVSLPQEVPDEGSIVKKFGIMLLELLSGRDPYAEQSGPTEMWAWEFLKTEAPLRDKMDPQMTSFPEDRALTVFQLIKQCLNPKPEEMLSMKEVTVQLREVIGVSPEIAAPLGYDLDIV